MEKATNKKVKMTILWYSFHGWADLPLNSVQAGEPVRGRILV